MRTKPLSICWLADRLHSLYKPGSNEKLVDITFILTDRKSLDTNIRDDIEKFTHLQAVVGMARKSDDLPRFLRERKSIIVTTQQKFVWVLKEMRNNPELKTLRVAFLIDEAHRSQEHQMGAAIRLPFRAPGEPDSEAPEEDPEELIAKVIREHDCNQLFVAFTATPAPATVSMFGFSDFVHPETNAAISEHAVNGLQTGELIEDRFEGDDYRLMVVASKFQTGFDQPLLAGMFLDKPVLGRNAVQTVSRLNRCHPGKRDVVVVDFTNNAKQILKAFATYRAGTPFEPQEPDQGTCLILHAEILAAGVFTQKDAGDLLSLIERGTDAQLQFQVNALRTRFQARLTDWEGRKAFVVLLARFVKNFHFLTCFFTYPAAVGEFATFAEYVGPQLVKAGAVSELMKQVRATLVTKAAVQYQGVTTSGGPVRLKPGKGAGGAGPVPVKVSVQDVIAQIRAMFDITDEEALYIAAIEFARRRIKPEGAKIETPADLLPHLHHYADRKQEHFLCASINGANEILNVRVVSIGLIDRSPVHPREVFADALADRACAVIVAHNHPSGGLEPSPGDIAVTAQLKAAGAIVAIALLDHIIFNRTGYFSFLEAGTL